MAAESYLTSWEIKERNGANRFSATLYGRALPLKEQAPTFGVQPRAERTLDHGSQKKRSEALGVDWEPLVLSGHWKLNFLLTGDARVVVSPRQPVDTPQQICNFFEIFARRQKELEVTWSGGVSRICDWDGFSFTEGIGPDRKWTMRFAVLASGPSVDAAQLPPSTPRLSVAALSSSHLALDRLLADMPDGFEPTFMDVIRQTTDSARTALARMRLAMNPFTDFARMPADDLRNLNNLAASTRDMMLDIGTTFEEIPLEYQLQANRSEEMYRAVRWQGDVRGVVNDGLDAILAVLDAIDARTSTIDRYVSVTPGDSLVRVAQRVYGVGGDWRKIADANGITGQIVPSGVSQLVIPGAGT